MGKELYWIRAAQWSLWSSILSWPAPNSSEKCARNSAGDYGTSPKCSQAPRVGATIWNFQLRSPQMRRMKTKWKNEKNRIFSLRLVLFHAGQTGYCCYWFFKRVYVLWMLSLVIVFLYGQSNLQGKVERSCFPLTQGHWPDVAYACIQLVSGVA